MPKPPFDLAGRVAIVTGGGRGIGAAIVARLAQAGATVVIANRTLDVAEALAGELAADGLAVRCVPFDKLDRASLRLMIDGVARRSSGEIILVIAMGIMNER